jgi:hypothetical protein
MPLSSTCAPWQPSMAFQQFLSGVSTESFSSEKANPEKDPGFKAADL